jgi:hypothetical protein
LNGFMIAPFGVAEKRGRSYDEGTGGRDHRDRSA